MKTVPERLCVLRGVGFHQVEMGAWEERTGTEYRWEPFSVSPQSGQAKAWTQDRRQTEGLPCGSLSPDAVLWPPLRYG